MTTRILIVDDVPANTRLLAAKLGAEYYQVNTARDGFEALTSAKAWQPDLILLAGCGKRRVAGNIIS
jgi:two-component system cell cycle response regulator